MDKLKRQLADAEAALEARKKPPEDSGPRIIGEGLVIDEWVHKIQTPHFVLFPVTILHEFSCTFIFRKKEEKDISLGSRLAGLILCKLWSLNFLLL